MEIISIKQITNLKIILDERTSKTKELAEAAKKLYDANEEEKKNRLIEDERIARQLRETQETELRDNYYDENGYIRAFPKHVVDSRNNRSWWEKLLG